ncbi:basic helixloop-helix (bHLH) family protein [Acanthamoeba castellanii str. Neff]|uniref:Basic helixloop-helix (BHLH) family protein n=1 Tax=Acanthamoeba castellanii (strain ATCC 30010 / Neff) TaxID=1257118 RepID=L8GNQ5_ACACF|nr:basic helixloop-helix (bHLH) family protein [Acanthamoeba castellanii str. Neff]ELR14504.1 basic helixloop-helix (bHLH) family protein [Acanthamoeba castellanii str. Neff]
MKGGKKSTSSTSGAAAGPKPVVVVLAGLPGSGKSTFATELERTSGEMWVRVSQDDLGSADEVKKQMEKAIKRKKSVIVDRCNFSAGDRKMWVTEAKRYGATHIEAIYFDVPKEECIRRASLRRGHPTLSAAKAEEVISEFSGAFALPTKYEGFAQVTALTADATQVRNELKRLRDLAPAAKPAKKK